MSNNSVLKVSDMSMDFGGIRALDEVDFHIAKGEIVALIGPNGAGKTTFFNCITGIYTPTHGDVVVNAGSSGKPKRINGIKPNKVTELGMARTFQNIRLFPSMTALENVMIGTHCRTKSSVWGAVSRNRVTREEERAVVARSYELLELVGLDKYVNELSSNLPYGKQRRLEIARALATDPFLLLLDEPAAGMNPQETLDLERLIVRIRDKFDISILLIEHDMKMVMSMSDRIYVLDYGRMIADGTPSEVGSNPDVIKAYLGEDDDD
ncbi:ABC transporter ATP-binding protein [Pseudodesulfovibrio tunisiensis]|uniref:ABC transporter ATP-binding protein n=1 Tax=Pseudodesulfovibrio tunisiensis TaxID=463192 RepID=UPI001FB24679|nr:ABC transporter ATP-binding protein [Pseudodesulfovibrio tunisiensis]